MSVRVKMASIAPTSIATRDLGLRWAPEMPMRKAGTSGRK